MRMLLMRIEAQPYGLNAGVLVGAVMPYATKQGIPAGMWETDARDRMHDVAAAPGMVVCETWTDHLYAIDTAGDAQYLGLRLPERPGAALAVVEETNSSYPTDVEISTSDHLPSKDD